MISHHLQVYSKMAILCSYCYVFACQSLDLFLIMIVVLCSFIKPDFLHSSFFNNVCYNKDITTSHNQWKGHNSSTAKSYWKIHLFFVDSYWFKWWQCQPFMHLLLIKILDFFLLGICKNSNHFLIKLLSFVTKFLLFFYLLLNRFFFPTLSKMRFHYQVFTFKVHWKQSPEWMLFFFLSPTIYDEIISSPSTKSHLIFILSLFDIVLEEIQKMFTYRRVKFAFGKVLIKMC